MRDRGAALSRARHIAERIAVNGVVDLSIGLWLRRHATSAGVLKVTPGLPLPKLVNHGGTIEVSDCRLFPGVRIECWEDAVVRLGKGTYLNRNTEIVAYESVTIGCGCKIARDVLIMDTDQHPVGPAPLQVRPVRIEDGAWIGSRAVILKGVTVGLGSVVGAGAIVTRDVPPFSVVTGPAARVRRTLPGPADLVEPSSIA